MAAARELLRSKSRVELHRKELAITAGVTPALVSYYFQDLGSLLEAVVKPLIEGYLKELHTLLKGEGALTSRLRALILFLIRLSHVDGQLIETYVNHIKRQRKTNASDFLVKAQRELLAFIADCQSAKLILSSNIAFTITALWGICKTIGQTPELFRAASGEDVEPVDVETMQADLILDLLTRGKLELP